MRDIDPFCDTAIALREAVARDITAALALLKVERDPLVAAEARGEIRALERTAKRLEEPVVARPKGPTKIY